MLKNKKLDTLDTIPEGVKFITAGVDIADNRISVEVVGWGDGDESWSLCLYNREGRWNASTLNVIDDILQEAHTTEDGRSLSILAAGVEYEGSNKDGDVLQFCAPRTSQRVWAMRDVNPPMGSRASSIFPRSVRVTKSGCPIHDICTQGAMDKIFRCVKVCEPGPGCMHISNMRSSDWIDQINSMELDFVDIGDGRKGSCYWLKEGVTNSTVLDCRVLALAALEGLRSKGLVPSADYRPTSQEFAVCIPKFDLSREEIDELEKIMRENPMPLQPGMTMKLQLPMEHLLSQLIEKQDRTNELLAQMIEKQGVTNDVLDWINDRVSGHTPF